MDSHNIPNESLAFKGGKYKIALHDDTYTFTNVQFCDIALSLYNNSPSGPVTGKSGTPQKWVVQNIANNEINIRNETAAVYVSVTTEALDSPLFGSTTPYHWAVRPYPGTSDTFFFVTLDGKYTWYLAGSGDNAVIVLKLVTNDIDDASQWVRARGF